MSLSTVNVTTARPRSTPIVSTSPTRTPDSSTLSCGTNPETLVSTAS
jgi:hypothetical protein